MKKNFTSEQHNLAIADHVAQENHLIDWYGAKFIDRHSTTFTRKVREAIQIRKWGGDALNHEYGLFSFDHVYNQLLYIKD